MLNSSFSISFFVLLNTCTIIVLAKNLPMHLNSFNIHSELPARISNGHPEDIRRFFSFPDPEAEAEIPTRTSFLPNLGFLSDLGFLFLPDFPASGMIRLGRDILESEECVEKVSCMATDISGRHAYLNWLHKLLIDFPFEGDLADRMKKGAISKEVSDSECVYKCSPTITLRRAFSVMKLLNDIVNVNIVANKIK